MRAVYLSILIHPLLSSGGQFQHFPVITGKSNIPVPGERAGGRQQGVRKVKKNGDIQDLIDFVSEDTENVETVRSRVMIEEVGGRYEDITRTRNISRLRLKTDRKQPKTRARVLLNVSLKNDDEKVSISTVVATKPILIRDRRKNMNDKNKNVAMARNNAIAQALLPEQLFSKNRNGSVRRRKNTVKKVMRVRF